MVPVGLQARQRGRAGPVTPERRISVEMQCGPPPASSEPGDLFRAHVPRIEPVRRGSGARLRAGVQLLVGAAVAGWGMAALVIVTVSLLYTALR